MLQRRKISTFDCVVKAGEPHAPVIVLLHGYGASCDDLAPLAEMIPAPAGSTWIFPDAPLSVPIGPHMQGKAWFPIDMRALEEAMMRGGHRDFSTITPPGMQDAVASLRPLIQALGRDYGDIYLGGFSQGGMIACDLMLQLGERIRGLILMSSTLVNASLWQATLSEKKAKWLNLPTLVSHGRYDPVLSFQDSVRLSDMLKQAGLAVEFVPFEGGHEIPPQVLRAFSRLISA